MSKILKVKSAGGVRQFRKEIVNKPCFAMFHMKGCGHCVALRPKWDDMTRHFKGNNQFIFAEIDRNVSNDITNLIGAPEIRGYPTLMIIKNGRKAVEYRGPRETNAMIRFVKQHLVKSGGYRRRSRKRRSRRRIRRTRRRRTYRRKTRRRK